MKRFDEMTEDEILDDALRAVPEYLATIRHTGLFDLERCVDLAFKRIENLFRRGREPRPSDMPRRHFAVKLAADRAEMDAALAHFRPILTGRIIPIRLKYIQERKVSEINAITAKSVLVAALNEAGFDAEVTGQRYRARVVIPVLKGTRLRFYVRYKDLNREDLLDGIVQAVRDLKDALVRLGPGAAVGNG